MTTESATSRTDSSASPQNRALWENHASLIVQGEDRTGIVSAVSAVLSGHGANIVSLDQYSDDPQGGAFYQRTVFSLDDLKAVLPTIERDLETELGKGFNLGFTLRDMSVPKRVAIFASKEDHCLLDLLWRHRRGQLPVTISMVVSNHTDTAEEVRAFGIPFVHVPTVSWANRPPRPSTCGCCGAMWTSWCWPATCGSCPASSCPSSGYR